MKPAKTHAVRGQDAALSVMDPRSPHVLGLALVRPGQGADPLCTQVRLGPLAVVASVGSHAGPSPGNSRGGLHTGSLETWGPERSGQDAQWTGSS